MGLLAFDADANLRTAAGIGRAMFRVDRRHRERARHNVALAFPDWPRQRVEAVTRASFEHFLQLAVEVVHTPRVLQRDSWSSRCSVDRIGEAVALLNARRPCILLTGHLGNWEVFGYLMALLGYRVDAIARPIDNPLINDWLLGIRERQGMRIITKWNATERMLEVLGAGGALAFIADQNAGEKGLFVPFFGRLASTYKSIGLLAISQNTPVICGYAHRVGHRYHFQLGVQDIIYPTQWEAQPDPLYYITARYAKAIQDMVRLRPEQYLWMHRRWKTRPRHERLGKPTPAGLRRNLEALPWMTDDQLAALDQPPAPLA
jgi:KDO2-lipid IV(A) lauroyltransferase